MENFEEKVEDHYWETDGLNKEILELPTAAIVRAVMMMS